MVKINLFILIIILFFCCDKILKDDKLELQRQKIDVGKVKLNGIYFNPYGNENKCSVILLYQNGTFLHWNDGVSLDYIDFIENDFMDASKVSKIKKIKFSWGVINVNGDEILLERWYPSEPPLKAFVKSGRIIDDSTFVLESSRRSNTSNSKVISDKYYFRKTSIKPDSSNNFVN